MDLINFHIQQMFNLSDVSFMNIVSVSVRLIAITGVARWVVPAM